METGLGRECVLGFPPRRADLRSLEAVASALWCLIDRVLQLDDRHFGGQDPRRRQAIVPLREWAMVHITHPFATGLGGRAGLSCCDGVTA